MRLESALPTNFEFAFAMPRPNGFNDTFTEVYL